MTVEEAVGDAAADPRHEVGGRAPGQGHRGARAGRAVAGRAVPDQVPARPVRRAEAAGRDRPGDHHGPERAGGRRADLDARHERAGQDPAADARPQGRARAHLRLHHPRPGQREVLLRPDRDHVPRPDRRDRADRGDLRQPEAPVHEGAAEGDPRAGPRADASPRDLPRGEIPDAAEPPLGCSFHPRCPEATSICGWESRDLRAAARGALDPTSRRRSTTPRRGLVGDLDAPRRSPARRGHASATGSPAQIRGAARARCGPRTPTSRCGRASTRSTTTATACGCSFHDGEDPPLRRAGGVEVACVLYPDASEGDARARWTG